MNTSQWRCLACLPYWCSHIFKDFSFLSLVRWDLFVDQSKRSSLKNKNYAFHPRYRIGLTIFFWTCSATYSQPWSFWAFCRTWLWSCPASKENVRPGSSSSQRDGVPQKFEWSNESSSEGWDTKEGSACQAYAPERNSLPHKLSCCSRAGASHLQPKGFITHFVLVSITLTKKMGQSTL